MNNVKVVIELSNASVNSINAKNYGTTSMFNGGEYSGSTLENNRTQTNAFIVGSTPVGNGLYMSRYGGYISGCGSSNNLHSSGNGYWIENGVERNEFYITIEGNGITKFQINFDSELGVYATIINVNGVEVKNSSFEFEYNFDNEQTNVAIGLVALNKPMKPIAIVNILFVDKLEYSESSGLKSVEVEHRNSVNASEVEYGIVSGGGSIEFVDNSEYFENIILSGRNLEWVPISIFVDGNKVGQFYSQRVWKYNKLTNVISTELQEVILKWQNIMVELVYSGENATLLDIANFLIEQSPEIHFKIDNKTKQWLQSINIEYPYLEKSSLWEQWNKVANIGQLVVYLLTNGTICVKRLI